MRLIDADALIDDFRLCGANTATIEAIVYRIKLHPTIDPASLRLKGFWEEYATSSFNGYDDNHEPKWAARKFYRCENCRKGTAVKSNFCPNCGADMRGDNHD